MGVAQFGSARDLGSRGRRFKSCLPYFNAPSPSGKAQDFDSCITLVRIQQGQFLFNISRRGENGKTH